MKEPRFIEDANELHARILQLINDSPELSLYQTIGVLEAVKADLLDVAKKLQNDVQE